MFILEIHRSITGWNSCTSHKALMNHCSTATAAIATIVAIATIPPLNRSKVCRLP